MKERPKDYSTLIDKYIKNNLMEEEGEEFRRAASRMEWQDVMRLMGYKIEEESDYQKAELVIEIPVDGITIKKCGIKEDENKYRTVSRHITIQNFKAYLEFLALGKPLKLPYFQEIIQDDNKLFLLDDFISRLRIKSKEYYETINIIVTEIQSLNNRYDLKQYFWNNIKRFKPDYMDSAMHWYEKNLFPVAALLHKIDRAIVTKELTAPDELYKEIRIALENYNTLLGTLDSKDVI